MKFLSCLFLFIFSLLHSSVASAAQACAGASYQEFDFWLGNWTVTTPDGKKAGTNRIEKVYDGCVITEHYSNTSGAYGSSINMYDSTTGKWYQTWGDKTGLRLQLEGQLTNGSMVMSGAKINDDGQTVLHQITWTPNDDGTVTQHWQVKSPNTSGWQTLFKGTYTKEE